MTILFHAHSGLRYLVLLVALIAVAWFLWGWLAKRPFERPGRIVMGVYVGLVDLQVLIGLVLFFAGRRPPGIHGHMGLMILAAVVLHVASAISKRKEGPARHGLPLAGSLLAATMIVAGILAIRDSLL
ncbi:MAG: hypothetical protein R3326_00800 [Gemmatimonadota bacterium]|nr:hypothetical protein [Gemmatimonadota bacterium]